MSKTLRWKKTRLQDLSSRSSPVNVDDVLIRPLGHAFSAQLHVVLDQNLTLKEAHKILTTKINAAVSERFGTEETTVIHLARRGLYRQARPRGIHTRAELSSLFLFVYE
jgi:divalent metal cation (Fe/Co/Zn/Cd) transporter